MTFSFRNLLLTIVGAFVLAWLLWSTTPALPTQPPLPADEQEWVAHEARVPDIKRASDFLATTSMWGNVVLANATGPEPDPSWRILATMTNGAERYVVLAIEKQPNQQLTIGDALPGGAKIAEIGPDALCVVINGKKRRLPITSQGRQAL